MTNTLYIIGNGFDLHHRIQSSFSAFGEYLRPDLDSRAGFRRGE
jgi:hypothetical protein